MTYNEILNSTEIIELNKILPVVKKVHNDNHPELTEIKDIYDNILNCLKTNVVKENIKDLSDKLITVTKNFCVPDDACPTFQKTYRYLETIIEYIEKSE